MYIYDLCKCELCGKTYKGRFRMTVEGVVGCIDCNEPETYVGLSINTVQYEQQQALLYDEMCNMLLKDLEYIYPLLPDEQDSILSKFDGTGDVDLNVIYFQHNSMRLIRIMQEAAYLAAHYIIQKSKEEGAKLHPLYEHAERVLRGYMSLRLKKLDSEQEQLLWNLVSHSDMHTLKGAVSYVQMA